MTWNLASAIPTRSASAAAPSALTPQEWDELEILINDPSLTDDDARLVVAEIAQHHPSAAIAIASAAVEAVRS